MNHLSRGGFITRSTKVGKPHYKKRTAALHKKRGDRKTQKRGFLGMGLFGGSRDKNVRKRYASASSERSASASSERSASASSNSSAKERHDRKRRAVSGAYNPIYGNPHQIEHSLMPPSRSPSPLTPPSPIRVDRVNFNVFFNRYCKKHNIVPENQIDVQNNLEKINKAYDKYIIDGKLP
jgi:hypothetical protein